MLLASNEIVRSSKIIVFVQFVKQFSPTLFSSINFSLVIFKKNYLFAEKNQSDSYNWSRNIRKIKIKLRFFYFK